MLSKVRPVKEHVFHITEGRPCLDFANTVSWRRGKPTDWLGSYADLLAWGRQTGVLTPPEADRLLSRSRRQPNEASEVLTEAVALREVIFRTLAGIVDGTGPVETDLRTMNRWLAAAYARARIGASATGFGWQPTKDPTDLRSALWPVVRSAGELLTSGDLPRLRKCSGRTCAWLFMDTTRNGSRRWCAMTVCGNRAKARRHYYGRRASEIWTT